MRADSSLLIQAMREGADCEHLFLADVGEQIGWRGGDKTKNVFSGRTRLSGDDVLNILGNPNIPIPDSRRYRLPHTRGDKPLLTAMKHRQLGSTPHTRG